MHTLAGDLPGFEEACRALYAGRRDGFEASVAGWPVDVQMHVCRSATHGF